MIKQANKATTSPSEFIKYKTINMNLEAFGKCPTSILSSFLVQAENQKLKFNISSEDAFTVIIEVPALEDALN